MISLSGTGDPKVKQPVKAEAKAALQKGKPVTNNFAVANPRQSAIRLRLASL